MMILILLVFVSFCLVLGALGLFIYSVRNRDFSRVEQLSVMPLEDDFHAN